ncbi:MAG TPA: 2-succinyl-5-enolpyruvyl-6-hydroxy-3-cyclohexene-1-carboxylic-acid synthase [Cytophagaceae bacterium]|jgi:2-succinyl-5-enolpyruvyl-6-hydroxy-3-cyclohexene-1-carboxylate synthase|nr:2-succinyl-5-enolpyruvyl-6-hydroxy-3-cyclohexene-1-carboxylic-acid synthase [Cytophagaceae bacterium]
MQAIYNISQLCFFKGIKHAVLSPGSRCAPLTISFARQTEIQKYIIPDERSAAFIGLGLSRITQLPTVLICTSGSAAYNYAPAVAEAYFQHIPLLILTADRPPEWIDQLDGQTIRQTNIYGNHVKGSFTLPVDTLHPDANWQVERMVNEAINLASQFPKGPVHINIPLREPFYPKGEIEFSNSIKIIETMKSSLVLDESTKNNLLKELSQYKKILVVAGQSIANKELTEVLSKLDIPVVTDIISNHAFSGNIKNHDLFLTSKNESEQALKPELLITFGNSIISKSLKLFLRKNTPSAHWHIQESGAVADTFQSLTKHISVEPLYFFKELIKGKAVTLPYKELWQEADTSVSKKIRDFIKNESLFSEFEAAYKLINQLPDHSVFHLANSMPVRYANAIGLKNSTIEVVANRGTSGIDGVISTAYGTALATDKLVTVLTGDMTFLYDRNAFWNNYLPSNLRIVILNNQGGGIFRMIDGPASQPEGEEYFVTKQNLTAENTLKDFDVEYIQVDDRTGFEKELNDFFKTAGKSKVMEVMTDGIVNTKLWKKFKETLNL